MDNAPDYKKWPIPQCGVDRRQMIYRNAIPADHQEIVDVAVEITEHLKVNGDRAEAIVKVIEAAKPTFHQLDQIYRHAFHPLLSVAIGEAMICPAKTRDKQIADAFAPVIAAAMRVEYEPPPPRKRSTNPATQDFQKLVRGTASSLVSAIRWGQWDHPMMQESFFKNHAALREEHLKPLMQAGIEEAKRDIERAKQDLQTAEKTLERLEALERQGGIKLPVKPAGIP
ncbi:hypothetical protein ASC97_15460 [Rhizobium sp. Root1203]|uniref:hypothetical protein n=1 Tax=Rhizobium sp. Root1203 TaxID=1736427 RepID=UPI00070AFB73|nr:hypothetical protein [Rhizobium sp. Root1203]KQV11318.1 hypothetical protein ASC97_15460 [Rhizobium sp. Root1203]